MDTLEPKKIYCFTGLAADERLFENLVLPHYQLCYIKWISHLQGESLRSYAQRLSKQIKEKNPILIGVSFGGMLAIEAAKVVAAEQTIIISSIQSVNDFPFFYRMGKFRTTLSFIPDYLMTRPNKLVQYLFGVTTEDDKKLLHDYLLTADAEYIRWALWCIVNWQVKELPSNLIHIHGNKDKLIPLPSSADYIIRDGGHMMVHNKAAEVSSLLLEILENKE